MEPYAQPSFLARVRSHVRAEGAGTVAKRLSGWMLRAALPRSGNFTLGGESYPLLRRLHGLTWATERAVEVPVAQRFLERHRGRRVLEVGNVLSHYMPVEHEIVDKYEQARGVTNADVLDLPREPLYDLILTISTLEHVGRDEEPHEPERAIRALEHLRGMLAPAGTLLATVPVGYNPPLDRAVAESGLDLRAMRRGPWREVDPSEAFGCPYDFLVYSASAVIFVVAKPLV